MDSNHRRRKPADLQSAPFGHSGNYPSFLGNLIYCLEVVPKTECKSTANFVKHQIFGELFPCNAYEKGESGIFLRSSPKRSCIDFVRQNQTSLKVSQSVLNLYEKSLLKAGGFLTLAFKCPY